MQDLPRANQISDYCTPILKRFWPSSSLPLPLKVHVPYGVSAIIFAVRPSYYPIFPQCWHAQQSALCGWLVAPPHQSVDQQLYAYHQFKLSGRRLILMPYLALIIIHFLHNLNESSRSVKKALCLCCCDNRYSRRLDCWLLFAIWTKSLRHDACRRRVCAARMTHCP